jgi:hypothetical protein
VVQGLKEALGKGVQQAVGRLGHEGGFLTNLNVKTPMPEKLRSVEKTLRVRKQDKLAGEEKLIRENPAARTSALLQKVFGAAAK